MSITANSLRMVLLSTLLTLTSSSPGLLAQAKQDKDAKVVEIVVEGVGVSKEAAQKDAYRQAIRQVVGMYVDSKTIVENDKLIEDKVLSASNGVIRMATTLPDSVTVKDGLWRLRAEVTVEVSVVSSRLDAAKIATRKVDGESLFAKANSKIEKKQNSEALLKELFAELPEMVKVSLKGEPDYDASKGELVYTVELTPDMETYREFLPRMTKALDAVTVKKLPDTSFRPTVAYSEYQRKKFDGLYLAKGDSVYTKRFESTTDHRNSATEGIVSILTFWNKDQTSQKWSNYIVDFGEVRDIRLDDKEKTSWLDAVSRVSFDDRGSKRLMHDLGFKVSVQMLGKTGAIVDQDEWDWVLPDYIDFGIGLHEGDFSGVPNLMVIPIGRYSPEYEKALIRGYDAYDSNTDRQNYSVYIAPLCMAQNEGNKDGFITFSNSSVTTRRIKFDPDQLKELKDVKISFKTHVEDK
jgi:hypothetical protein